MEQIRRLVPRQFTDWRGKCMFEDDPGQRWRDCRVLDVSSAGAGLTITDVDQDEPLGREGDHPGVQAVLHVVHRIGHVVGPVHNLGLQAAAAGRGPSRIQSKTAASSA